MAGCGGTSLCNNVLEHCPIHSDSTPWARGDHSMRQSFSGTMSGGPPTRKQHLSSDCMLQLRHWLTCRLYMSLISTKYTSNTHPITFTHTEHCQTIKNQKHKNYHLLIPLRGRPDTPNTSTDYNMGCFVIAGLTPPTSCPRCFSQSRYLTQSLSITPYLPKDVSTRSWPHCCTKPRDVLGFTVSFLHFQQSRGSCQFIDRGHTVSDGGDVVGSRS